MDIQFVTIETRDSQTESNLLKSAKINGIDIEVLGKGVKWKWFITKFEILDKYLTNVYKDYICFVDSKDVLFLGNLNNIKEVYKKYFLNKIVLNTEIMCWPDINQSNQFPNNDSKFKYLNSGCYIGPTKLVHQLIKESLKFSKQNYDGDPFGYFNDDQYLFHQMYISGLFKDNIELDYGCKLFQTLHSTTDEINYLHTSIYNVHTKSYPLIIHGNGHTSLYKAGEVFCRKNNCVLEQTFTITNLKNQG